MTIQGQAGRGQVRQEHIASALRAVRMGQPRISDVVAVVGGNALASATVAVLLARGVSQVALVSDGGSVADGAKRAGAQVFTTPTSAEALRHIQMQLGGYGPDFVFGCDGNSEARQLAIELGRAAGMIIFLCQDAGPISLNPNLLVFPDKRIKGIAAPTASDLALARDLLTAGTIVIR